MSKYLSTSEIAMHYGVHPQTIRRWGREGRIEPHHRTFGNHRRFAVPEPAEGKVVGYVRVSSVDQKDDLAVQEKALKVKAQTGGIVVDHVITDIGSGMNYKKKGFRQLISLLMSGQVRTLVLMHRDRLLRFGAEIIFLLCKALGVTVVILEPSPAKTVTEQLCMDLVEIMTVFTNKLYGMRSRSNLKALKPK
jgi:excisionase family DNA binding protein